MTMKCSCKALVALAGGIAMISSAAVASPSTSNEAPAVSTGVSKASSTKVVNQTSNSASAKFAVGANRGVNDTCESAGSVDCGGSAEADLTTAAPGIDSPFSCAIGTGQTNTLWYSFTVTAGNNAATVQTCNSTGGSDSTLNIFSGSCGSLVEIGCNDDGGCGAGFLSSATATGLVEGETYYVQVGAWDAASVGTYTLEVDCFFQEVGDDTCENAETIECGGSVEADLTTASPGIDSPFSCAIGTGQTNTLWYSFVATDNAATIQTCNSAVGTDSTVNVFSGACGALVEIGCSDDACGSSGFNSSTTVSGLTVGDTYYIQIGAWSAATVSTYTLEVDCFFIEPCDTCVDGSTPEGEPILVDGDTDVTNGGCNSDPDVFGSVSIGETICGTASLYLDSTGAAVRDTDWYQFTITETTAVEWVVTSELPVQALLVNAGDCSAPAVIGEGNGVSAGGCQPIVVSADLAPGTYVAFAAFPAGSGQPNGTSLLYNATLQQGGLTPGACCDFDGNCFETIEAECDGFFTPEAVCADVECITVDCPDGALIEGGGFGEELFDGYNDELNSGCNATAGIAIIDFPVCGDVWCGTSGTHLNSAGGQVRDTDWYQFDVFETTEINWRVTGTFDVLSFILEAGAPGDECTLGSLQQAATGPAGTPVDNIATLGPGTYFLFVSTQVFTGVPANAPYVAELICIEPEVEACCFGDGSCEDLLGPDCAAAGGIPQGAGVLCADSPCCVVCDGSENAEGEQICEDEYVDLFNSGCNAGDGSFPTSTLTINEATCGTTGTFTVGGVGNRDTDWYSVAHPGGPISMTVSAAGYDALFGILNVLPDGSNCGTAAFLPDFVGFTEGCGAVTLSGDLPAGTYICFVSTADFTGVPCGFEYNVLVEAGDACDPTCGDVTGDGNVDLADLNLVLGNFGSTTDIGDANCDGVVDLADLNLVLGQFGGSC